MIGIQKVVVANCLALKVQYETFSGRHGESVLDIQRVWYSDGELMGEEAMEEINFDLAAAVESVIG